MLPGTRCEAASTRQPELLYLDTSALVKLYLIEAHSTDVQTLRDDALFVSTSRLSYVEVRSAFARRRRERSLPKRAEEELIDLFDADWPRYRQIEVAQSIVTAAGALVSTHALRAYDAVHLASAIAIQKRLGSPITFAAFDQPLNRAAKKEGLRVIGPIRPGGTSG